MIKNAKIIILICWLITLLTCNGFSFFNGAKISLGNVSFYDGGSPLMVLESHFAAGDVIIGTSINAQGQRALPGYESFVINYLEYDDGIKGLKYEPLDNVSFGYGLLLNDFNTSYSHPIFLNNMNNAIRSYYNADYYTVGLIKTCDDLYGVNIRDLKILGLGVGFEYISAAQGLAKYPISYSPYDHAYGIYLNYPIFIDGLNVYSEHVKTSNNNSGASLGLSYSANFLYMFADLRIEGRAADPGFVPGYFSYDYYVNPINLTSFEASGTRNNGTFARVSAGVLGFLGFGASYENYPESFNSLSLDFIITPVKGLDINGYCKQPTFRKYRFISDEEMIMVGGSVEYTVNNAVISVGYKKAPLPGETKGNETSYVSVGYKLF